MLHLWFFIDVTEADGTQINNATEAMQLAISNAKKARKNPANYEQYFLAIY